MKIIEGTTLSNMCDYSFGDHMGATSIPRPKDGFMKFANATNTEFLAKCKEFEGRVMTLFIDNIRLYTNGRTIWANAGPDADWVAYLMSQNDLLLLCAGLTNNKFVIFCSHEDTPIDSSISIPPNVLGIHAVNAEYNNDTIHPFPYGIQRELGENDNRATILKNELDKEVVPSKLLYINCGIGRNKEREPLADFQGLPWVTTRFDKDSKYFPYERYKDFLDEMRDHKFMICPQGHGMDCHRNWESLYMRRVPVMRDHPYFRRLMKGFPVLFVKEWSDVTEQLLEGNDHLFQQAQEMDLEKLDLNYLFKKIMNKYGEKRQAM